MITPKRIKAVLTVEVEYTRVPEYYPDMTDEEALTEDKEAAEDDPWAFFDRSGAKFTVKLEELNTQPPVAG